MQNEPNFSDDQINVNKVLTRDYGNISNWTLGENEPKTNPIKANTKPIKANIIPKQTQYKANQSQFQKQKNAAKSLIKETNWHFADLKDLADLWLSCCPVGWPLKYKWRMKDNRLSSRAGVIVEAA